MDNKVSFVTIGIAYLLKYKRQEQSLMRHNFYSYVNTIMLHPSKSSLSKWNLSAFCLIEYTAIEYMYIMPECAVTSRRNCRLSAKQHLRWLRSPATLYPPRFTRQLILFISFNYKTHTVWGGRLPGKIIVFPTVLGNAAAWSWGPWWWHIS